MTTRPPSLTMADQLLVNLAGCVVADPVPVDEVLSDVIEAMARVLGQVSRDGVMMRDLADACTAMVQAYPVRRRLVDAGDLNAWARAMFDVRVALLQIFRWRAGQAAGRVFVAEGTP